MNTGPWTKLHPLARIIIFLGICLQITLCEDWTSQALVCLGLLMLVIASKVGSTLWRFLIWMNLIGLPGIFLVFILTGYERSQTLSEALAWGMREGVGYALRIEGLFLANLALIGTTSARELMTVFYQRWAPTSVATLLSTAVRFIPVTIIETRRIYDVQRCRCFKMRPWAPRSWLPIIVPLFISQMCRAHETALMMVVRRIGQTGYQGPQRQFRMLDWIATGSAVLIVGYALL